MPQHVHQFELNIGDVVCIGEHTVTVIDIDGDEVIFRVDAIESELSIYEDSVFLLPPLK